MNTNLVSRFLGPLGTALMLDGLGGQCSQAQTNDTASIIAELQKQVAALREEVDRLKSARTTNKAGGHAGDREPSATGLKIGFYGESKYRFPESGANAFDAHRYVLAPSYRINDWLSFHSEIEFEHGGVDETVNGGRNRFDGAFEIEQFYVDLLLHERFNIRSLGIDLVPVGRINLHHEPTTFYSTERPELYREIIPSTWFEPAVSVFGKLTDSLDYKLTLSAGLEDSIATPSSAATATRPAGFAEPGITGRGGVRDSRPRARRADVNSLAYAGRLSYHGPPGLDASTSFYVTQVKGPAANATLALFDVEAVYRVPKTGLELRGDFAYWHIGSPQNLVVNNNTSTTDNVGDAIFGWYLEAAYHLSPEAWRNGRLHDADIVPFVRYSSIVTQTGLATPGVEEDNGRANKDFVTTGVAWFLNSNFVLKFDWRHNLNGSTASKTDANAQDYFQIGAGLSF